MGYKYKGKEREYRRQHYLNNKGMYLTKNRATRKRLSALLRELKSEPCMDCGVAYPYYVMDFDHRDPETKKYQPNRLTSVASEKKLLDEVAKCDVVCSNCHRERTQQRLRLSRDSDLGINS